MMAAAVALCAASAMADTAAVRQAAALGSIWTDIRLWDGGRVAYYMDHSLAAKHRAPDGKIKQALRHWEEKTCIRFEECAELGQCRDRPYIHFTYSSADLCMSGIGRSKHQNRNDILLAERCTADVVVHEVGHSLGLNHEQNRNDRDEYVDVRHGNIKEGWAFAFDKAGAAYGRDIGPYDYDSIMHYRADHWSKNGEKTIVTPNGEQIGVLGVLSAGDVATIDFMYNSCRATYDAPRCVASRDASKPATARTGWWGFEFNARYSSPLTVTYSTAGHAPFIRKDKPDGSVLPGSDASAHLRAFISSADRDRVFRVAATFTAADGKSVACALDVVANPSPSALTPQPAATAAPPVLTPLPPTAAPPTSVPPTPESPTLTTTTTTTTTMLPPTATTAPVPQTTEVPQATDGPATSRCVTAWGWGCSAAGGACCNAAFRCKLYNNGAHSRCVRPPGATPTPPTPAPQTPVPVAPTSAVSTPAPTATTSVPPSGPCLGQYSRCDGRREGCCEQFFCKQYTSAYFACAYKPL